MTAYLTGAPAIGTMSGTSRVRSTQADLGARRLAPLVHKWSEHTVWLPLTGCQTPVLAGAQGRRPGGSRWGVFGGEITLGQDAADRLPVALPLPMRSHRPRRTALGRPGGKMAGKIAPDLVAADRLPGVTSPVRRPLLRTARASWWEIGLGCR